MNNRYICKGKRKDNKKWVEGDLIQWKNGNVQICLGVGTNKEQKTLVDVIPETVCRCTELKDKNSKLIFEGDIIITDKFNTPEIRYTIVYDKEIATFIGEYKKGCVKHFTTFDGDSNCFEVIGNIHDNPELLEVERWTRKKH